MNIAIHLVISKMSASLSYLGISSYIGLAEPVTLKLP